MVEIQLRLAEGLGLMGAAQDVVFVGVTSWFEIWRSQRRGKGCYVTPTVYYIVVSLLRLYRNFTLSGSSYY